MKTTEKLDDATEHVEAEPKHKKTKKMTKSLRKRIDDTVEGLRESIPWPWPQLSDLARALLPGTVTLVCGAPGSCKSLCLLQCLMFWLKREISSVVFELEDDRDYHLNRVLAQQSQNANLLDPDWIKANPTRAKAAFDECEDVLEEFIRIMKYIPEEQVTSDKLAEWICDQCKLGRRIIVVDPVTATEQTVNTWIDDGKFLTQVKTAVRRSGSSLILVTHPKKGNRGAVGMDDLAGGAAYQRFAHTILWIERHSEWKEVLVKTKADLIQMPINITLHICNARNGPGAGLQLAYKFDETSLLFAEQGIICRK